jgi:hypothetical protein
VTERDACSVFADTRMGVLYVCISFYTVLYYCFGDFLGYIYTHIYTYVYIHKVKVKFSLEQAMKAQRGSRGIALLFL